MSSRGFVVVGGVERFRGFVLDWWIGGLVRRCVDAWMCECVNE